MSYCRKEGKDIIIFATEEELSGPSSTQLLPDNPDEIDSSSQSAILPNGEINWDCPCLGNLPHGPCGEAFRGAFSCWASNRDDQTSFAEKCFEDFSKWEDCLDEHRDVYRSSSHKDEDQTSEDAAKNESLDSEEIEAMKESEITEQKYSSISEPVETKQYESRSAIAAASVDSPVE